MLGEHIHHSESLVQALRRLGGQGGRVGAGGGDEDGLLTGETETSTGGLLDARRLLGRDALLLGRDQELGLPNQLRRHGEVQESQM